MTDQPPSGRPDFDPPPGTADGPSDHQPSDYRPPIEPAGGPLPEDPGPQASPPAPPPIQPPPQPDGRVPPAFYPGPPGQQPFPPPPRQAWREAGPSGRRGSIVLGLVISLALLAVSTFGALSGSSNPVVGLVFYIPIVLLVGGIVLAAIPRTTRTGAGILIGIGASILIAGGLCVALLAGLSG